VTFHRWKKQFGQLELSEAKRLKELERENAELKKMLAESLLKNRVLEAVCEKKW
jgi:putative transposase